MALPSRRPQARAQIKMMIHAGKRRFVVTDVYFSGGAYNKFQNDLIGKLAEVHPECSFRGMWLREQLGFEEALSSAGEVIKEWKD